MAVNWQTVDAALKGVNGQINDATMEVIWRTAWAVWKRGFEIECRPVPRHVHTCSSTFCRFDNVHVDYTLGAPTAEDTSALRSHSVEHLCVRVVRNGMFVSVSRDDDDMPYNAIVTHCSDAHHHQAESAASCYTHGRLDNLYVCAKTGLMHVCAPGLCIYSETRDDMEGQTVCTITGRVLGSHKMVSAFWKPYATPNASGNCFEGDVERPAGWQTSSRGAHTSSSDMISPDALYFDDMTDVHSTKVDVVEATKHMQNICRRRPIKRAPYKQYLMIAIFRVSVLFSRERFMMDQDTAANNRRLAMREVQKLFNTDKNMDGVALIAANKRALRRRNMPVFLNLPPASHKLFATSYARMCVGLWCVIRTSTRRGREEPNLFPIKDFTVAAMYIFAEGIYLPPQITRGAGEQVLVPDPILRQCMPQFHIIDKLGCDRDAIATIKKNTISAIVDAVFLDEVNPKDLHPDHIKMEDLDEMIFQPLRKNTGVTGMST